MGYVSRGRGLAGFLADDAYDGPDYPRIQRSADGSVTRVTFWPGLVAERATWNAETQRGGERPGIYPGVVPGARVWYPVPGTALGFPASGPPADWQLADWQNKGWTFVEGGPPAPEPERCVFNGSASFYFHPEDSHLPVTQRRYAQGPTPGDPDSGHPGTPTFPTGAGNTPGYRAGTPGNPYRPWLDPASEWYGCETQGIVVDPVLPPTYDPWEPVPPIVDGPWEPDPEDPDGPLVPIDPDPASPDPEDPEPIPCWDGRTGRTGFIDPVTGDCVPSGGGGPADPGGSADPGGPTGDPSGPPPDLPPGGGGVSPPGGGDGAGGLSSVGMGLGVLLVLFLASRKR